MYGENSENVDYYLTLYNEPYQQPAEPENLDKASSEDAENLIEKIKKEVFKKTNVNLELELEVVGKKCWVPRAAAKVSRVFSPHTPVATIAFKNLKPTCPKLRSFTSKH